VFPNTTCRLPTAKTSFVLCCLPPKAFLISCLLSQLEAPPPLPHAACPLAPTHSLLMLPPLLNAPIMLMPGSRRLIAPERQVDPTACTWPNWLTHSLPTTKASIRLRKAQRHCPPAGPLLDVSEAGRVRGRSNTSVYPGIPCQAGGQWPQTPRGSSYVRLQAIASSLIITQHPALVLNWCSAFLT